MTADEPPSHEILRRKEMEEDEADRRSERLEDKVERKRDRQRQRSLREWRYRIGIALVCAELLFLTIVGLWTIVGALKWACSTGWTMEGLLTALNTNWKGALLLGALLFYRTVHEILARVRKFNPPFLEMASVEPVGPPAELPLAAGTVTKPLALTEGPSPEKSQAIKTPETNA